MNTEEITVKTLSPCFCAGADPQHPEIRAASIRGHLRRWHTRLTNEPDMKNVWGTVGRQGGSSEIQLRVEISGFDKKSAVLLPHKTQGSGYRNALVNGEFNVLLRSRNQRALNQAFKALQVWSLLGSLGTRANRAAGSIWPASDTPTNISEFKERLDSLGLKRGEIRVSSDFDTADALRTAASDTLAIPYLFGAAKPRKESPLKIKMVEFDDRCHLLLFAEQNGVIDSALNELQKKGKPLGKMQWEKIR